MKKPIVIGTDQDLIQELASQELYANLLAEIESQGDNGISFVNQRLQA